MPKTPQRTEADIRKILEANGCDQSRVNVVAIRGYYLDSMGRPGRNDRGIYDDAHFVLWPDGYASFQGNTDPSRYRKGRGYGRRKGMAVLKKGIHIYGKGSHRGTKAFRQCEKFTVIRDSSSGGYEDKGFHAINWHRGGYSGTSSLGCQTNPRSQFLNEIRPLIYSLLDRYRNPIKANDWKQKVPSFDYVLVEETDLRKNKLVVSQRYL